MPFYSRGESFFHSLKTLFHKILQWNSMLSLPPTHSNVSQQDSDKLLWFLHSVQYLFHYYRIQKCYLTDPAFMTKAQAGNLQ